jgi:hypothetical protein
VGHLGKVSGEQRGEERQREERAVLWPALGASFRGGKGVVYTDPIRSQRVSAPAPLPTQAAARRPGSWSRPANPQSLPTAPGLREARDESPIGCAVQPLRPSASGRRDPRGSGQARTTIPDSAGLALPVLG